jgi:L-fuconolactonase
MLITDAQVHLWEVDRPERPWPKDRSQATHLPNGLSADEFIAEMDAAGVDRAVIVPPTYVGEMNDTALEACEAYPGRFAVMGRFNLKAPDAREQLRGWLAQPNMLGIRLTTFISPIQEWYDRGGDLLDWFWADCEKLGIPIMILLNATAHKVKPVAEKFPKLRLIMDHMACDLRAQGISCFDHNDELVDLAQYPHVYVKMSSAPCFSLEPFPHNDIKPYLKQIYDAFGPRRIMWGADFSRLEGTYSNCVRHIQEGLDFLSEEDKEWILGKTLAEVLRWPEYLPSNRRRLSCEALAEHPEPV